jgi:hypothetical protein
LQEDLGFTKKHRPLAYQNRAAEYVDPLTAATRLEFGDPDFDSRPAQRRTTRRKPDADQK